MFKSLSSIRQFVMGSAGMGSLLVAGLPGAWADGPHSPSGIMPPAPAHLESSRPMGMNHTGMGEHSRPYPPAPEAERIVKPGYAVLPPPGTLGQTYWRQSWPIPREDHPRTAIIQITAPGFNEIEMEGLEDMEGFQRPDGVWIFKTDKPLTPGISHIYHVKAGYKHSPNGTWQVQTVRLIPGRVVTLGY